MNQNRFSFAKAKEVMSFVLSIKKETYKYQGKVYKIRKEYIKVHKFTCWAFYGMLIVLICSSLSILANALSATPFMADNFPHVFTVLLALYLVFFYPFLCMVVFPEPIKTYLTNK